MAFHKAQGGNRVNTAPTPTPNHHLDHKNVERKNPEPVSSANQVSPTFGALHTSGCSQKSFDTTWLAEGVVICRIILHVGVKAIPAGEESIP